MKEYINVNDQMPDFLVHEPHAQKLILLTKSYGEFLGFYDGEHFRTNYATILENVTHWCYCPKRPDGK